MVCGGLVVVFAIGDGPVKAVRVLDFWWGCRGLFYDVAQIVTAWHCDSCTYLQLEISAVLISVVNS